MTPGIRQVGRSPAAMQYAQSYSAMQQPGLNPAQAQAQNQYPQSAAQQGPDPYWLQQQQMLAEQQAQAKSKDPLDKALNWFNGLPLWGKVLAGGAALGGVFLGGRFVLNNAGNWGTQFSRAFKPTPLGSKAVKDAKYALHDSRAETRVAKHQLEQLEQSLLNHENALNQAEVRVKRYGSLARRLFWWAPGVYTNEDRAGLENARRARDAAKLSKKTASGSLAEATTALNQAKIKQYNAHLDLLDKATAAMIEKQEDFVARARKRLQECEDAIAKTKDAKQLEGLRTTKLDLEKQLTASQARLAEAERIHNQAVSLESLDAYDIDVTNTGYAIKGRGRTGGVAVQHRLGFMDPSTNLDYKKATASPIVRDENGRLIPMHERPHFGQIGPIAATSTKLAGTAAYGILANDRWADRSVYAVDANGRMTSNLLSRSITGVYRLAEPNFFEWLLGKKWWTMPVRTLTAQDYMTDSQVANPSAA